MDELTVSNKIRVSDLKRIILNDNVIKLFILNFALVIGGYGLATVTDGASLSAMNIVKSLALFLSLFYYLTNISFPSVSHYIKNFRLILFFCFALVIINLFQSNWFTTIQRTFVFIIPFIYVLLTVFILLKRYGFELSCLILNTIVLIVFCIPGLSYVFTSKNLLNTNIYGYREETGQAFYSNHYGWASVMFILAGLMFLTKTVQAKALRVFIILFSVYSFFLILVSSSRSSLMSLAIALMIYLFRTVKVSYLTKFAVIFSVVCMIVVFAGIENSAIYTAINRTEEQQQGGETRFEVASHMLNILFSSVSFTTFGIGLFNYKYLDGFVISTYHNSYLEILFGAGVFLFFMFFLFTVYEPVKNFFKYGYKYNLLLPPLLIIPFFESNLTGGQFLFFPWFFFVVLHNAKKPNGSLNIF